MNQKDYRRLVVFLVILVMGTSAMVSTLAKYMKTISAGSFDLDIIASESVNSADNLDVQPEVESPVEYLSYNFTAIDRAIEWWPVENEQVYEALGYEGINAQYPYAGFDYTLGFEVCETELYRLPDFITVTIDGEAYQVYTDGLEHRPAPADGSALPPMPSYDPDRDELTIPAILLTAETKSITVAAEAVALPAPTAEATATVEPELSPAPTATAEPDSDPVTETPAVTPLPTPTLPVEETATPIPTAAPSPEAAATETPAPSAAPTPVPSPEPTPTVEPEGDHA